MDILCPHDLKKCPTDGASENCKKLETLPWALVEYNEIWCPDGEIMSRWPTKEKAEEIYNHNELNQMPNSIWKIMKVADFTKNVTKCPCTK